MSQRHEGIGTGIFYFNPKALRTVIFIETGLTVSRSLGGAIFVYQRMVRRLKSTIVGIFLNTCARIKSKHLTSTGHFIDWKSSLHTWLSIKVKNIRPTKNLVRNTILSMNSSVEYI